MLGFVGTQKAGSVPSDGREDKYSYPGIKVSPFFPGAYKLGNTLPYLQQVL
jgi:hypothetical protein